VRISWEVPALPTKVRILKAKADVGLRTRYEMFTHYRCPQINSKNIEEGKEQVTK